MQLQHLLLGNTNILNSEVTIALVLLKASVVFLSR